VNGQEAVRKKRKRCLIIVGIFVVVVVLEAVSWMRTCYAHPEYWIDFCQISNFDNRPTPTRPDEVDFASLSSKELSRFLEIALCSDPVESLYCVTAEPDFQVMHFTMTSQRSKIITVDHLCCMEFSPVIFKSY
jgi:hypothetical protein